VQMKHPRWYHSSVIVGDTLYVFGGVDSNGSYRTIERTDILANGDLTEFKDVSVPLVNVRLGPSAAVVGDRIYLVGGAATTVGDFAALNNGDSFSQSPNGDLVGMTPPPLLNQERWTAATLLFDNQLMVLGGFFQEPGDPTPQRPLNGIEVAAISNDGQLGSWTSLPKLYLALPRNGGNAIIVQNQVYVFGGIRNLALTVDTDIAPIGSKH